MQSHQSSTALIDLIVNEGAIGCTEAAAIFGEFRRGKPTQRSTILRWMLDGISLSSGRRLKLESFRLGGRMMTSRARCIAFILAQQDGASDEAVQTSEPTQKGGKPKKRKNSAKDYGRRLASIGA